VSTVSCAAAHKLAIARKVEVNDNNAKRFQVVLLIGSVFNFKFDEFDAISPFS
jgi:hypothetical protein